MPAGDQGDILRRLRRVLPTGWFPDIAPTLDAILSAPAQAFSWIHDLLTFAGQQTRLATASGAFLDLLALDFLGVRIERQDVETDDRFRVRIRLEILRAKGTRAALAQALRDATGYDPDVFEPANATDIGGGYSGPTLGYGVAGAYGSLELPFQTFVTAYRPPQSEGVSDADIYSAAAAVLPAATVAWVQILDAAAAPPALLGRTFVLGQSRLGDNK